MRRFQFSLRTLFFIVTAICLWLGYEAYYIHRRAEVYDWIVTQDLPDVSPLQTLSLAYRLHQWESRDHWWANVDDSQLPFYRKLLGDHFITEVGCPANAFDDDVERVKSAFPEANIQGWHRFGANSKTVN